MRKNFGRWMGSLLVCATASAMAQSICADVSAHVDAAALAPRSARSAYNAGQGVPPDARGIDDADLEASSDDRGSNMAKKKESMAGRRAELISRFGYSSHPENSRAKMHFLATEKDKQTAGSNKRNQPDNSDAESSWVSLPDSTRGTGLVNPPDQGTVSPMDWSPSFGFELPDFSDRTFLNPTLHVGGNRDRQTGAHKVHRAPDGSIMRGPMRKRPSPAVSSPLNDALNPGLSHEPGLHSSIPDTFGQQ